MLPLTLKLVHILAIPRARQGHSCPAAFLTPLIAGSNRSLAILLGDTPELAFLALLLVPPHSHAPSFGLEATSSILFLEVFSVDSPRLLMLDCSSVLAAPNPLESASSRLILINPIIFKPVSESLSIIGGSVLAALDLRQVSELMALLLVLLIVHGLLLANRFSVSENVPIK